MKNLTYLIGILSTVIGCGQVPEVFPDDGIKSGWISNVNAGGNGGENNIGIAGQGGNDGSDIGGHEEGGNAGFGGNGGSEEGKECDLDELAIYTQRGWGSKPAGENPGALLHERFSEFTPGEVYIGVTSGNYVVFTSAQAITNFLPQGGKPNVLEGIYENPTKTSAGVLAGQTLALTLNLLYNDDTAACGHNIRDLQLRKGNCKGRYVQQVFDTANFVLAGLNLEVSPTYVNECVNYVNNKGPLNLP